MCRPMNIGNARDHFLKGVVPVAREARVKLAVHPYDPGGLPLGYQGVDNWDAVDYRGGIRKYIYLYDDPYNGLCYEVGVTGVIHSRHPMPNCRSCVRCPGGGRIVQVHFRNIRGGQGNFVVVYDDEGDTAMLNCGRVLRDTGWEGTPLPDPQSQPCGMIPRSCEALAFSYGYIEGLFAVRAQHEGLRGLTRA